MPTRIFDAKHLWGNLKFYDQIQTRFVNELKRTQLLKKFNRGSKNPSCKLLKNHFPNRDGSIVSKMHADLSKGVLFYDPSVSDKQIKATKYILLRPVQYTVSMIFFRLIKAGKVDEKTYRTIPKNTVRRIDWLQQSKILRRKSGKDQSPNYGKYITEEELCKKLSCSRYSEAFIGKVKTAYLKALSMYHRAEQAFQVKNERTEMAVDKGELMAISKTLFEFVDTVETVKL